MQDMGVDLQRGIELVEGEFVVKMLEGNAELTQAYQLRHRVFAESLRWVSTTEDGREMDMYDLWGLSIGLVDSIGKLHGLARLLPASGPFMLEKDLRLLLPLGYTIRKESDTAEITRLTIDPDIKDKGLSARLMLTLIKGIYHWALEYGVRYLYLAVDHRFLRVLKAIGIPAEPLGPPVALPPAGTLSIAAMIDIVRCEEVLGRRRPAVMAWMSTILTMQGERVLRTIAQDMEVERHSLPVRALQASTRRNEYALAS